MKKQFTYRKAFVMSLGILGIQFIWAVFNYYVPLFLQAGNPEYERQLLEAGKTIPIVEGFGLGPTLAFFIMTWDNILNVFVQPWAGLKSDYTRSRFGKRKPWLMVGAPMAAIGFLFIPVSKTIFMMMVFIMVTNLGMALFRSPALAWLGDLFEPEDRSRANGVINLMGGLGGAIAGMVGGLLFDHVGRSAPFIFSALGMLTFVSAAILFIKEPKQEVSDAEQGKPISLLVHIRSLWDADGRSGIYTLLTVLLIYTATNAFGTGSSSFAVFTLGIKPGQSAFWLTLTGSTFILFALPSGILGSRVGGRRMVNIGLILGFCVSILGYFLVQDLTSLATMHVFVGLATAFANVNILPMVFQHGSVGRFGANTGMYYLATQSAAIIGPIISGLVIEASGNNFRMIFPLAATILIFSWFSLRKVSDRPGQPTPKKEI
jgi:maltose/moltooligosaccharide transporter